MRKIITARKDSLSGQSEKNQYRTIDAGHIFFRKTADSSPEFAFGHGDDFVDHQARFDLETIAGAGRNIETKEHRL
jgi:hypothetical protein